jgi:Tol biopolymer transport system component
VLKRAALVAVVLAVVGCGSMEKTGGPEPESTERHLVYEKIIGERGIWIADVDGGKPRLLFAGGRAPQISPDGEWVAYLDECDPSTALCSIFLVPVSGGKSRLLARGSYGEFSWSPDSNRIAAARLLDEEDLAETLLTLDVASGDSVTLAEGHLYGWSFSPDGKQIVYAVAQEPSPEGLRLRLTSSARAARVGCR